MTDTFNPTASQAARALQAWQILIAHAMNRQTLTYEGLSKLMYQKSAAGVLNKVLAQVAFVCIERELPPLTSIVVGKHRGSPGDHIPVDLSTIDSERERVYAHDWWNERPPTEQALDAALRAHSSEW